MKSSNKSFLDKNSQFCFFEHCLRLDLQDSLLPLIFPITHGHNDYDHPFLVQVGRLNEAHPSITHLIVFGKSCIFAQIASLYILVHRFFVKFHKCCPCTFVSYSCYLETMTTRYIVPSSYTPPLVILPSSSL